MKQLQGQIPDLNPGTFSYGTLAIGDFVSTTGASWSNGSYRLLQLSAQPTLSRPWTIYGWGIQAKAFLFTVSGAGPVFGKLGAFYASLIVGGSLTTRSSGSFQAPTQDALPNLVKVWDGDTDPPPPFLASNTSPAPIGGLLQTIQQLPQPVRLNAGDQLGIGLWLTPMLVSAELQFDIYNLTYTVNYD